MPEEPFVTLTTEDWLTGIRTGTFTSSKNGLFSPDFDVASAVYREDANQGLLRPPNGIYSLSNDGIVDNIVASTKYIFNGETRVLQVGFEGHLYDGAAELIKDNEFNLKVATLEKTFDVSSEDTVFRGISFNGDGSKMFVIGTDEGGGSQDFVYSYNLSTNYDVDTATYSGNSFNVSSQANVPLGMTWNDDGTQMYIADGGSDAVYEYSLSTAYDITTASVNSGEALDISGETNNVDGVTFDDTGDKLFIVEEQNDSVHSYNLSTAYDVSTGTYANSLDISGADSRPGGIEFNNDGSKMFIVGRSGSNVYAYNLSTNFDITTASFHFQFNSSRRGPISTPHGLAFNDVGDKMYTIDTNGDDVRQFDINYNTDLRADTPIVPSSTEDGQTTVANGLAVFKPKNGDRYLYYAQNTQIGRWDLEGLYPSGWTDNWKSTDVETTTEKPMYQFQDRVYFGNGSYVGFIGDNGSGGVNFNPQALDLPSDMHITSLSDDGRRLIIAATRQERSGTPDTHPGSKIFFWDTNADSWNKAFEMDSSTGIASLQNVGGTIYALESGGLYQFNFSTEPQKVVEFQPDETGIGLQQFVDDTSYEQNNIEGVANHQKMTQYQNGVIWLNENNDISFYGQYTSEQSDNILEVPFGSYPNSNIISFTVERGFALAGTAYYVTDEFDYGRITVNAEKATEFIPVAGRHDVRAVEIVFGYPLESGDDLKVYVVDTNDSFVEYGRITYSQYGNKKRVRLAGNEIIDYLGLKFEWLDGQAYIQKARVFADKIDT
jgi:sugar lactone lactonase YvrE